VINLREIALKRLKEFEILGKTGETIFDFSPFLDLKLRANIKSELVFCISTANSGAISGIKFQKLFMDYSLENADVEEIKTALRVSGVRFYNKKALYIKEAMERFEIVEEALKLGSAEARELLCRLKGIGYKEASHFLRNIGRLDVAIIDRHILRWLENRGYISFIPKSITKSFYLQGEEILKFIAKKSGLNLAVLDLFIWYKATKQMLK